MTMVQMNVSRECDGYRIVNLEQAYPAALRAVISLSAEKVPMANQNGNQKRNRDGKHQKEGMISITRCRMYKTLIPLLTIKSMI